MNLAKAEFFPGETISEAAATAEVYQSKSIHLHPDDKHFTIPQTHKKWRQVRFISQKYTNNKID